MTLEAELNEVVKAKLPYITDELWEMFNDTCLMTWDKETSRPNWTQLAVDFVCELNHD